MIFDNLLISYKINPWQHAHYFLWCKESNPNPCSLLTCVVQSSKDPELIHGVEHVVLRWRVHEVEEEQILHTQRLQKQDYIG